MSIVTKSGDSGTTALMYNRRVAKCDPRVEAVGAVDELNAAVGLARATSADPTLSQLLLSLQQDLVTLMGELATAPQDLPRYVNDGHALVTADLTAKVHTAVQQIEAGTVRFAGWATPGANLAAAALDLARTVCRRAERRACALQMAEQLKNPEVLVFLNRLSDLLWLLARKAEAAGP